MNLRKILLWASLLVSLLGCKQHSNAKKDTSGMLSTLPAEHLTPAAEQQARRQQSEAYCTSHQVPIYTNPNALFTDTEAATTIRTKDEVVDRALALYYIGLKSEGMDQANLDNINQEYNLHQKFSDSEQAYIKTATPTAQQTADANWRYESLHVMLWALGFTNTLS
ncbi:MAG: DUF4272 domain-containing protein, partial [Hymenobacter sp.]